jgi:hypothetical protein
VIQNIYIDCAKNIRFLKKLLQSTTNIRGTMMRPAVSNQDDDDHLTKIVAPHLMLEHQLKTLPSEHPCRSLLLLGQAVVS